MSNQEMNSQELHDLVALKQLHKGKGVTATVFGIISLIACLGPISFICGIVAIIVGSVARKKSQKTTGTAGMVMGIIGVVISIIGTVLIASMMAGVMGPQLFKYIDKTEIASDTMICDTVRTAMVTCLMDPAVISDEDAVEFIENYSDGSYYDIRVMFNNDNEYTKAFKDIMGVDTYDELREMLKSDGAYTIEFAIEGSFDVSVRVPGTDIEAY